MVSTRPSVDTVHIRTDRTVNGELFFSCKPEQAKHDEQSKFFIELLNLEPLKNQLIFPIFKKGW